MQVHSSEFDMDSREARSIDELALVKKAYEASAKKSAIDTTTEWHTKGSAKGLTIPKTDPNQMLSLLDQAWRPYNSSIPNTLDDLDGIAVPAPPSMTKAGGRAKKSRTVTDVDVAGARDQLEDVRTAITYAEQDTTMDNVNAAWIAFRRLLSEIYRLRSLGGMQDENAPVPTV